MRHKTEDKKPDHGGKPHISMRTGASHTPESGGKRMRTESATGNRNRLKMRARAKLAGRKARRYS